MEYHVEENKEKLLNEIQRLSEKPIGAESAMRLATYGQAYKAICLLEKQRQTGHDDLRGAKSDKLTPHRMMRWVECLENEDGTTGPHFTWDQVEQYRNGLGIRCESTELYTVTNMMYSDYCRVLKKYGADRIEVYIELAQAYLEDKDAKAKDKLASYYEHIVEGK